MSDVINDYIPQKFNAVKSSSELPVFKLLYAIINDDKNANLNFHEKIELIEKTLLLEEQLELPVSHMFANGLYIRQIFMPKGTLVTSTYHKTGQFDIMMSGVMSMITADGVNKITAPYYKMSSQGVKRLAYMHEDVVWLDIRVLPSMSVEKAEEILYTKSYKELLEFNTLMNQEDYALFLVQHSLNSDVVKSLVENTSDQIYIDINNFNVELRESTIEGLGMFANEVFNPGDVIGPARVSNYRTQFGRYINHAKEPNAVMYLQDDIVYVVVVKRIDKREEITVDYRQAFKLSSLHLEGEISCHQ